MLARLIPERYDQLGIGSQPWTSLDARAISGGARIGWEHLGTVGRVDP